jgi:hypothetical protein
LLEGALATGALATGALATGALATGALAIERPPLGRDANAGRDQPKRRNSEVAKTHPTNKTTASVSKPIMASDPVVYRPKSYRQIAVDSSLVGLDNR